MVFPRSAGPQNVGRLAPAGAVSLLSSHLRTLANEASGLSLEEQGWPSISPYSSLAWHFREAMRDIWKATSRLCWRQYAR